MPKWNILTSPEPHHCHGSRKMSNQWKRGRCPGSFAFQSSKWCSSNCSHFIVHSLTLVASQVVLVVKNLPAQAGDITDIGSIPGSGRSPEGGHANPLQPSCLEKPTDKEPGGLRSMASQRVGHDWNNLVRMHLGTRGAATPTNSQWAFRGRHFLATSGEVAWRSHSFRIRLLICKVEITVFSLVCSVELMFAKGSEPYFPMVQTLW